MSLTDNPINLLIQLGIDATSKTNINTEIEKLSKSLDKIDIKLNVDEKALKALNDLANTDFGKLVQATENASKKFDSLGSEATKASQEVEGSFKDVQNTLNKTFAHLGKDFKDSIGKGITEVEELKRAFKGMEASFKMDYEVVGEKESGEQIRRVKAIEASYKNLQGQIEKVKFNNNSLIDMGEGSTKNLWLPDKDIKVLDTVAKQTQISMQGLQKELNTLRATGKLTESSFNELSTALSKAANPTSIALFNQRLDETLTKEKQINDAVKEEIALKEKIRKLQNSIVSAQQRDPKNIGSDPQTAIMLSNLKNIDPASKGAANSVKGVSDSFDVMKAKATAAGRESMGLMESFSIAMQKFPVWMAASTAFFGTVRSIKSAITQIVELDSQITVLRRVAGDGVDVNKVMEESIRLAQELGNQIADVNDGFIAFARQGFKGDELSMLAEYATLLGNISDLSVDESAGILTAGLKAFNLETEKGIHIVDALNEVDNTYSVTTQQLAESMQRSAGTASVYGSTLERLLGYTTAIGEVTRESGSVIGNSLKSIFSRMTSVNGAIEALDGIGISVKNSAGEMRQVDDILDDLGAQWSNLNVEQQQNIGLQVAGRYQLSRFLVLMNQYDTAMQATETALNSQGSGYRENAEYLKSYEAQINMVKNAWTEAVLSMQEGGLGDGMIVGLKAGLSFMNILTQVIDKVGLLPAVLGVGTLAFLVFSNNAKAATMSTGAFISNLLRAPAAINGLNASLVASTVLMRAKTAATNILTGSLRTLGGFLAGAFLPVAGFMALGAAISWVTGKVSEQIEEQKMLTKEMDDFKEKSLAAVSTNKDQVDELIANYTKLSEAKDTGDWNNEKEQEYLRVQEELTTLFPAIISHIDDKGVSHAMTAEQIDKERQAILDLYQAEELLRLSKSKDDYKERIREIEEYANKAKQAAEVMNSSQAARSRKGMSQEAIKTENLEAASNIQVYERLGQMQARALNDAFIQDLKAQISGLGTEVSPTLEKALNDALKSINLKGLDESQLVAFRTQLAELGKGLGDALNSGDEAQFDKLSNSFGELVTSMGVTDEKAKKLVPSFGELKSHQDNLNAAMAESKNIADEESEGLDGVTRSAEEMKKSILDAFSSKMGIDSDSSSYQALSDVLNRASESRLEVMEAAILQAEAEGLSAEQTLNNIQVIGAEVETIGALADERYNLVSTIELLSGVSQNLINDTDDLLFMYDQLKISTAGQTEEDYRLTAAKQQLLDLYPNLFSAGTTALNMTDQQINAVRAEVKANDVLMAAYAASRDGKLTSEQEKTTSSLANTNARITNINAEIAANNKLIESYSGVYGEVKAAAEAGSESAAKLLMRISVPVGRGQMLQADLAKATAQRTAQTNILSKALEVANRTTTKGNQGIRDAAKASDKASKAKGKNAAASKKQTKAQKEATKAMEQSIFVANKYKRALEDLELQIKKQQDIQSKFPDYNAQYKTALTREIALQKEKKKLLQNQNAELQKQIKAGSILKTGVITTTKTTGTSKTVKASGFSGRINSNVGYRRDPVNGKKGAYHAGVDLQAANGTRLDAPVSGKVIRNAKVGQYGGLGNAIVIQDANGLKHIFGHLSKSIVKLGQQVTAGQQIGNTGNTGKSTGPHLHYELRDAKGNVKNPISYINAAKKGIKVNGSTSSTVSKEVAQNQYDIESAQSELTNIAGSIIEQQALIEQLEMSLIKTELSVYEQKRDSYDRAISYESEKIKTLDVNSQRYGATIERIGGFLKNKQKANQDELKYIEAQIKKGKLSAIVLDEMKIRAEVLKTEMLGLADAISKNNYEKITVSLQRYQEKMDDLAYSIQRSQLIMATFEEGSTDYNKELNYQVGLLKKQADATKKQHAELQKQILTVKLGTEEYNSLAEEIKKLSLEYWTLQGAIKDSDKALEDSNKKMAEEAADALIDAFKQYLEEKRDMHLKSLDKELEAEESRHKKVMDNYQKELDQFRKIVQEKIDSLNKEEDERDYNKEIDKMQEERLKIIEKINLLKLDDSDEAKSERKKLQEQLDDIDENISEKRHKREIDLRKENLENMIKDKEEHISKEEEMENERYESEKERIDKLKEYWEQYYVDQLNDERRFAQMKKDIIAGNLDGLSKEFQEYIKEMTETMPDLENTLNGTMEAVGTSIRQNIIDNLKKALEMLDEVKKNNTNSSTGSSGGGSGSSSEPQGISNADLKVMTAKFLAEKVNREEQNPVRQQYIRDRASQMAKQGRDEGSKISSSQGFEDVLRSMSKEDRVSFAEYLNSVGVSSVSTPELQDFIRQYSKNLKSGNSAFETGGYTGSWGSSGRTATLHEEEFVLNKGQTKEFFKVADFFDNMRSLMSIAKIPNLPVKKKEDATGDIYEITFEVENMNATRKESEDWSKMFMDDLKRKKGG